MTAMPPIGLNPSPIVPTVRFYSLDPDPLKFSDIQGGMRLNASLNEYAVTAYLSTEAVQFSGAFPPEQITLPFTYLNTGGLPSPLVFGAGIDVLVDSASNQYVYTYQVKRFFVPKPLAWVVSAVNPQVGAFTGSPLTNTIVRATPIQAIDPDSGALTEFQWIKVGDPISGAWNNLFRQL
jgi:hypothetical protein